MCKARTGFPTPTFSDAERKECATKTAASDLEKPIEQLLTDIHHDALSTIGPDERSMACTTAKFASLLCRISMQADRIQRRVVWLTWAIAAMTLVLVALTIAMLWRMQ